MNIQLVIFDVDGTLYDLQQHCVPESTIQAIARMKKNGIRFAIATGRAHYGLGKALNDLHADYVIADNGGVIVDNKQNILYHKDIPYKQCCQLIEFAHENDSGLIFKFPKHMYIYQHPEKIDWLAEQMNSDIGRDPFIFHPEQDRHFLELPQCASLHADKEKVMAFAQTCELSFRQYSQDGFDVAPFGINKGTGIARLLELLHMDKENCACFGDNYNDVEMMEACGYRIAMGNAVDDIKKIADHVTAAIDEEGIRKGLEFLHLI